jgi:hypothetical protein
MPNKKITVKHYLNKRAKPRFYLQEEYYPVYIQLIVDAKKAQIKSRINHYLEDYQSEIRPIHRDEIQLKKLMLSGFFTDGLFERIQHDKIHPIYPLLNDEINVIKNIIGLQHPFDNKDFTLNNFSTDYEKHVTEITDILDQSIKESYRLNLNKIFLDAIDKEEEKKIFTIVNFFIHYINWDNTFSNFYEITFEVLPSELKLVENYLDKDLFLSIKAYLAYHSKANILKRYMEKQEQGKISTLSYLDWITYIKEFIVREFTKLFGKKKAIEYVSYIDSILDREIRKDRTSSDA